MNSKTCTKCQKTYPANLENFYRNAGGKFGLTPRCKPCVNEDNVESHKKRLEKNPEKVKAQASARTKKHYHNNLETSRAYARDSAAKARKDPEKYKKIQTRKRAGYAGLSVEALEVLLKLQENKCAICNEPNPTDLDHCHKTGIVRWLLCKHCNRGLGAFKDSPELLRKAAEMLETVPARKS